MSKNIQKAAAVEVESVSPTTARVVESLVLRGDISALSPEERSSFYVQMCESLGLNPAANPLAILRLNGKEILYPTKGATDQLAYNHRLNREIIEGPKVIDLAGTKMVYAVCKATHPNGRVETAVATVPLSDPLNALMKAETKAKRRATLSILGLGMLDESELDTIPAYLKSPGTPIDVTIAAALEHPALAKLRERLCDGDSVGTFEAVVDVYEELAEATNDGDVRGAAGRACVAHLEETLGLTGKRGAFQKALSEAEARRAAARRAAAPPISPALAGFRTSLEQIELPGEAVALWIKHRAALAELAPAERETAWRALCKRTEEVGKMKNAKVWLKRAIAEDEARRGDPDPFDDGPRGGGQPAPVANDAPADVQGDAYEGPEPAAGPQARAYDRRHPPRTPAEFRARIEKYDPHHAARSWALYRGNFTGEEYVEVEDIARAHIRKFETFADLAAADELMADAATNHPASARARKAA